MAARSTDNEISRVLSVLSEPTRIRIIRLISGSGELRSCDLLPEFEITQPTLSHHLNILLENDVLTSRKEGRCVYFSINKGTMSLVADLMAGIANGSLSKPASKKAAVSVKPAKKEEKADKPEKPVKVKPEKVKKDKKDKDKDKKKKKKDKKDKKKKK
ncbi:MAG: metalloregulator ArsR/SmtB family transcription factor [Saccharofermentans sp.]|nr:metalloregulator ArsR/SmtB family transcription factor [Saccharofermentans sp.]